jgi:hypothetical protein
MYIYIYMIHGSSGIVILFSSRSCFCLLMCAWLEASPGTNHAHDDAGDLRVFLTSFGSFVLLLCSFGVMWGSVKVLCEFLGILGGPLERPGCEGMRWKTKVLVL